VVRLRGVVRQGLTGRCGRRIPLDKPETEVIVKNKRGLLTVYFGAPSMFITLWFGFDYGTNPPLGTLII
jgi:hypothetical protein